MKIFDDIPTYTDEEFKKFYEISEFSEDTRRKLDQFTTLITGKGTFPYFLKPVDKVYGESILSQYRSKSLLLPCGCPVESVPRWTEAMWHMLKPENCPTQSKKEKL